MKIFPKILLIGIVGLLVAAIITGISIYSNMLQRGFSESANKYRIFRSELTAAQVSHFVWLRNVSESIIAKKPGLKISTDGKVCPFGLWYYSEETKKIVETFPDPIQKAFNDINADHLEVHRLGGELTMMWKQDNLEPCVQLFNEKMTPLATRLLGELKTMEDLCQKEVNQANQDGAWIQKNQDVPTIAMLVIGILVLIPYAFFTARGITRPLNRSEEILMGISEDGNLDVDVSEKAMRRKDEIGVLARCIQHVLADYRSIVTVAEKLAGGDWRVNVQQKGAKDSLNQHLAGMLDHLNHVLAEINGCTKQVASASVEVSNASQTLMNGSQITAASLEEISASMNEISGQTKKNAEGADQASVLANQASQAAVRGHEAMQEMVGAMQRITGNSQEIQRVIRVIDDIAFQTNLLALNAAVEAARAGQHGKGFAVVAEEVRNLASRSAKAAKETSELITKSGQEIEKGNDDATRTAEVLDIIVEQIKKTTDLVAGIAVASNEQAQGVGQITLGLQQIDSVIQQNTAATEESSGAVSELSSMAINLQHLLAQFKLRD